MSKREKEILQYIAKGFSSKEIARELFVTKNTVDTHRRNMIKKAKANSTKEICSKYRDHIKMFGRDKFGEQLCDSTNDATKV